EGMVRNSAWKFENASASWLDTYKGDIFSRDVIRRHYFQRECAEMSVRSRLCRPICGAAQLHQVGLFRSAESANAGDKSAARPPPRSVVDSVRKGIACPHIERHSRSRIKKKRGYPEPI
ncbi:MAG: hypothetical protein WBO10_03875, partial [Pyrinomonadaceae bacterium]